MTRVYLERDGSRYTVDAREHAGTSALCAAVSCLLYTLAGWLHNVECVTVICERMEPGDARLEWRAETPLSGYDSLAVFEFLTIGFLQLRESEPDGISVEVCDDSGGA